MQIRQLWETDGKCFGEISGQCIVLVERDERCGTYLCPFYKPDGCKDWLRIERKRMVKLFLPEEVTYGR